MNYEPNLGPETERDRADAMTKLFDQHWPAVWHVAYAITGQRGMATDIAQDAFVRAIGPFETFTKAGPSAHGSTALPRTALSTFCARSVAVRPS